MAGNVSKKDHRYNPRLLWLELGPGECREYCHWEINLIKAELLYVTGNWEGAEESYRLNLSWARKDGLDDRIARSEAGLGDILQAKGSFDGALGHLNQAYERFESLGDAAEMAHIKGKLGTIKWKQGRLKEALGFYNIQKEMSQRAGDLLNLSRALGNLGSIYAELEDNDRALEFYQSALEITHKIGHRRNIAITLCNLGTVYWSLHHNDKALECYQQALEICQEVSDKRSLGMIYGNLGALYHTQGDILGAIECQKTKMGIMENLGDRLGKCSALNNVADILMQEKEYSRAEGYLNEAVAIASELQVGYHLCEYLCQLAELYLLTGREKGSAELADRALPIASQAGREEIVFKCRILKIRSHSDAALRTGSYQELLKKEEDAGRQAEIQYHLFKTAGREEDRRKALSLYEKLQEDEPNKKYQGRIAELWR